MSSQAPRQSDNPARTEASVSSPPPRSRSTLAPNRSTESQGTGFPLNIEGPYPSFTQVQDKDLPRGNRQYDFMMRSQGHYGHFLPFDRKACSVTPITLDANSICLGIRSVLRTALIRALPLKGYTNPTEIETQATNIAITLSTGCMMMFYCRLRAINKSFFETSSTFILKPHVPDSFEIPTPYAIAFQNLGLFRAENLVREIELIPTVSAAEAEQYCLGTSRWSPPAYQTAMELAKSVGISFQRIDLTVKYGSAWWLLNSVQDDGNYSLNCCLPESNYTKEDAVIRALWCVTDTGNFHVDIADLSALTLERGTFLRNPPPDIAVTCFYGMMEAPAPVWDIN